MVDGELRLRAAVGCARREEKGVCVEGAANGTAVADAIGQLLSFAPAGGTTAEDKSATVELGR